MKVMHASFAVLLVFFVTAVSAGPSPVEMAAEVTDNVAMEYAECAAFFSIVSGAFSTPDKVAEAKKFKEASNNAAIFSLTSAKQSREEGMAAKVTLARIEMSMKDMQKTIGNNYSNMSLLSNKYLTPCVEAMGDPGPLVKRWTERIQSKYDVASEK